MFIITTPTPIDDFKKPDLTLLSLACETVGKAIKLRKEYKDKSTIPIIVLESTVYPGVTEEICVPIIEKVRFNFQ